VLEQSRHLADRLVREAGDGADRQITLAYMLALARPPSDRELRAMRAFLRDEEARTAAVQGKEARRAALVQLCRVIFNLNEFVYPD
jgi:hypothetical protein